MTVIMPVWVDGSFFGSAYIMSRLDSGDFCVGSGGFGWFQVVSGGFGWFRVVSCFIYNVFNVHLAAIVSLSKLA